jgi:AcrR family transcriptional regulator
MSEHSLSSVVIVMMTEDPNRRRRVPALAPQERRAAIIEATVPLLREHGVLVTTRQIADAAGVAEGTIFGVFRDKPSLIRAAVLSALDPEQGVRRIAAIQSPDLRVRLAETARILTDGFELNGKLFGLLRGAAKTGDDDQDAELHARIHEGQRRMIETIAQAFEPDRDQLRVPPVQAAQLFVTLHFANNRHAMFASGQPPLSAEQIVSLLLDGLLKRPSQTSLTEES